MSRMSDKYNLLVDMVHGCVWAVNQFPDVEKYPVPEEPTHEHHM